MTAWARTAAGLALLVALGLAGCGSAPAAATPKTGAGREAAKARHASTARAGLPAAPAPVVHRSFDYEVAVNDALPNTHSMVGLLQLVQTGSALSGRFRLFHLVPLHSGILDPRTAVWAVRGSVLSGSGVRLDFQRAGGNPDCLLFPCSVGGKLSPAALDLKPAQAGAAGGTVRLTPGSAASYRDRVTAIMAYVNGYDDYVAGQRIEASRFAHAR